MSISFIVPTLNEQGNVSRVYSLIVEALENTPIDWEMIFVDDKSTDNTQLEIRKLDDARVRLIISPERRGLGAALSLGWRNAKYQFVLFLDCDTGISHHDLVRLISKRRSNALVIGSRYIKGSHVSGAPKVKLLLSKLLNKVAALVINVRISDLSHSLRILPNSFLDATAIETHPGYFWMQCSLFRKHGYELEEVPITFRERDVGLTKNATLKMIVSVASALPMIERERFK